MVSKLLLDTGNLETYNLFFVYNSCIQTYYFSKANGTRNQFRFRNKLNFNF